MFIDFFFYLRQRGLKVTITEWMSLLEALTKGLAGESLVGFYHLCRSVCVKSEAYFDLYDQAFAEYFHDLDAPQTLLDEVLEWLEDPVFPRELTPEELAQLKTLDLEALRKLFEERLAEQEERHDRGDRWIGTGGASPFGHGGTHPSGMRVGGSGGGRSAIQIAASRRFRNLRSDIVLDTRQISVALRRLRKLARDGVPEELDLDETVDATARNYGDIDLIFRPERKNTVKLLLLMDVGGSMTPYTRLCERLFSAAHAASHFKAFKAYYFHNCPYSTLYEDMERRKGEPTGDILNNHDHTWTCIMVGDAAMAPYELTMVGGAINYFHNNPETGLTWLQKISERYPRCCWLNPEPEQYWGLTSTTLIREIFEMYPLTLSGLDDAVHFLRTKKI